VRRRRVVDAVLEGAYVVGLLAGLGYAAALLVMALVIRLTGG